MFSLLDHFNIFHSHLAPRFTLQHSNSEHLRKADLNLPQYSRQCPLCQDLLSPLSLREGPKADAAISTLRTNTNHPQNVIAPSPQSRHSYLNHSMPLCNLHTFPRTAGILPASVDTRPLLLYKSAFIHVHLRFQQFSLPFSLPPYAPYRHSDFVILP